MFLVRKNSVIGFVCVCAILNTLSFLIVGDVPALKAAESAREMSALRFLCGSALLLEKKFCFRLEHLTVMGYTRVAIEFLFSLFV
jgi:hypothetical protein